MTEAEKADARILAWVVREMDEYPGTEYRRHLEMVRQAISRGDHLKGTANE